MNDCLLTITTREHLLRLTEMADRLGQSFGDVARAYLEDTLPSAWRAWADGKGPRPRARA